MGESQLQSLVQGTWGHNDPPASCPATEGWAIHPGQCPPPQTQTHLCESLGLCDRPQPPHAGGFTLASTWGHAEVLVHYGAAAGGPDGVTTSFSKRRRPVREALWAFVGRCPTQSNGPFQQIIVKMKTFFLLHHICRDFYTFHSTEYQTGKKKKRG